MPKFKITAAEKRKILKNRVVGASKKLRVGSYIKLSDDLKVEGTKYYKGTVLEVTDIGTDTIFVESLDGEEFQLDKDFPFEVVK